MYENKTNEVLKNQKDIAQALEQCFSCGAIEKCEEQDWDIMIDENGKCKDWKPNENR